MLNSLQNGRYSFIFTALLVHTTHFYNLHQNSVPLPTLVNFHLPIPPLLFNKIILTTSTNTPFIYATAIFHLAIFGYNHPSNLHQKYFPYHSNLANSNCVKEQESYEVLISPLFLKVWTVMTGLTITDSLLLRLKKLVHCR